MHLVFLNQYYPPDEAPTGLMLEAVADSLVADGHQVTIICAQGGYAGSAPAESGTGGRAENPAIRRIGATRFGRRSILAKLADYASYYLGVAGVLSTISPPPDRIVALTTPPYLSILARMISRLRGGDHAHWVMDLYPDVMVAHGMLRERALPHRMLAALSRWGLGGGRCATILTLGPDMADRVSTHLSHGARADWVPLWGTDSPEDQPEDHRTDESTAREARNLRRLRGWADDDLIFMYSGNMGLGHRFGEFLAAALRSGEANRSLKFVFFGGGKRRKEIEEFIRQHPDAPVELHDYVPRSVLAAHLASADVHLASLEESWTGTMLPSKLQGVFAAGRPVVFVGGSGSSTARWIEESGAGLVVAPGDDGSSIVKFAACDLPERGRAARDYAAEHFSKEKNASRIAAQLATPRRGR